ncbi:MAG: type II toxin-antitoxin system mRNA interferase toxin, RelE/StbE family [bacterium]|nr:type II toxin-antitoxin system mRNA interferase toxin, RelE/StbE family [bacterium]
MNILLSKRFEKMFEKCPREIKLKFIERLKIYRYDKYSPALNNHPLTVKLKGYRSINISGDYRAIFKEKNREVIFIAIGTHSQLYR